VGICERAVLAAAAPSTAAGDTAGAERAICTEDDAPIRSSARALELKAAASASSAHRASILSVEVETLVCIMMNEL